MNLQAIAAMDDPEHATGKTLEQHVVGRKTAKEVIAETMYHHSPELIIQSLRAAGYHIVQVVSSGNKHA